ncbi:hypothetical protein [Arthrobacter sp. ISL-95]|uniref:hypothetical protein n=1 Tax=Arthrobacter sp. ISL-95 TaxID=2819116 RepID=UPI001BEBAB40|nr:hypothetical protein [Arthrobacter sp. ISL-95]MBT2587908.1 hypothetical protein [Arthrobacter sp. ISL-95]
MSREQMKARLEAADLGPLTTSLDLTRKWVLLLENGGTEDERLVAKCVDDDESALFAHAPTDLAKLHAALDAVEVACDDIEQESDGQGLDLQDDDFDRGWHGARRETAQSIRTAIWAALGECQ